jgi:hypothetical protein
MKKLILFVFMLALFAVAVFLIRSENKQAPSAMKEMAPAVVSSDVLDKPVLSDSDESKQATPQDQEPQHSGEVSPVEKSSEEELKSADEIITEEKKSVDSEAAESSSHETSAPSTEEQKTEAH